MFVGFAASFYQLFGSLEQSQLATQTSRGTTLVLDAFTAEILPTTIWVLDNSPIADAQLDEFFENCIGILGDVKYQYLHNSTQFQKLGSSNI